MIFLVSCKSLRNTTSKSIESEPTFSTAGEAANYFAKHLFEQQYVKSEYSKFTGEMKVSDSEIQFGEWQFVEFLDSNSEIKLMFKKGLLYPDIFGGSGNMVSVRGKRSKKEIKDASKASDTLKIVNHSVRLKIRGLEELTFLSDAPTVKRFELWVFIGVNNQFIMNPEVYYFELTNETANKETDLKSFIENAKLTFIHYGGVVI